MFQHVTLKRRWPPHNLALVFMFQHVTAETFLSFDILTWPTILRGTSKYLAPCTWQTASVLPHCQSVYNKLFRTNVNYIAIDQRFHEKYSCFHVWVWPQHYLASVLFSHFNQKSLTWPTTYIVNSEFLARSLWFCHMPTPSAFGINYKPLFAPRCT